MQLFKQIKKESLENHFLQLIVNKFDSMLCEILVAEDEKWLEIVIGIFDSRFIISISNIDQGMVSIKMYQPEEHEQVVEGAPQVVFTTILDMLKELIERRTRDVAGKAGLTLDVIFGQ